MGFPTPISFGSVTYPGNSSLNATVPNDAPIQPAQAFVDNALAFADHTATELNLANKGITSYNPTRGAIAKWFSGQDPSTGAIDIFFSGNALDAASIHAIFVEIAADPRSWPGSGIDVSGGTNAAVLTPVFTIDFNNLNVSVTGSYGACDFNSDRIIHFTDASNLSASTVDFSGANSLFEIGIQDSPTKQQIITKLVAIGGGKVVDLTGLKISIALVNHALEPFDFFDMAGSGFTQGNNDIGNVQAKGWVPTTN